MTDSKTDDAQVPTMPKDSPEANKGLKHEQADQSQTVPAESDANEPEASSGTDATPSGA